MMTPKKTAWLKLRKMFLLIALKDEEITFIQLMGVKMVKETTKFMLKVVKKRFKRDLKRFKENKLIES